MPQVQDKSSTHLISRLQTATDAKVKSKKKDSFCIKTSKTWVLPPRPKPGRKPNQHSEKRKSKPKSSSASTVSASSAPPAVKAEHDTTLEEVLRKVNKENSQLKTELSKLVSDLKSLREQVSHNSADEMSAQEMTRASSVISSSVDHHTSPMSSTIDDYEPISRKRTHEYLELESISKYGINHSISDLIEDDVSSYDEEHDDKLLKSSKQPQIHHNHPYQSHYQLGRTLSANNSVNTKSLFMGGSFFDDLSTPSLVSGASSLILSKHSTLNSEFEDVYGKVIDLPSSLTDDDHKDDDMSNFIDFTFFGS